MGLKNVSELNLHMEVHSKPKASLTLSPDPTDTPFPYIESGKNSVESNLVLLTKLESPSVPTTKCNIRPKLINLAMLTPLSD